MLQLKQRHALAQLGNFLFLHSIFNSLPNSIYASQSYSVIKLIYEIYYFSSTINLALYKCKFSASRNLPYELIISGQLPIISRNFKDFFLNSGLFGKVCQTKKKKYGHYLNNSIAALISPYSKRVDNK